MNLLRVLLVLIAAAVVAVVVLRFVLPTLRRARTSPTIVPGTVVEYEAPLPGTLPLTRGHGYDTADVDGLLERVYALSSTASGRAEALGLVRSARFHLERSGGYEPTYVDRHMDALAAALSGGGELPPKPGYR
ncbi:MAG: hypothetical protein KDB60_14105 [Propionibacteriaceae bacterium]|nr:hypothetical protein [Propionibacteriaceae bacterium]